MKIIMLFLIVAACLRGPLARAAGPIESWGETPAHGEPRKLAIPDGRAYAGAYIDFGQREDEVTRERIERFDELVGKQQAIVAFSSDWGNQSFPEKQLRIIANYGAVPLVYWSPWDRPGDYKAPPGGGRFDLEAILAGRWDAYIDFWATEAREYGRKYGGPILVSWGLEMNGDWFPWSGFFYGKGNLVDECANCFAGPELYKKTYRYVVDRVRANGVSNIIWVWHPNNSSSPDEPWNAMAQYYPGPDYVDWLALSAYGTQYPNQGWISVDEAMNVYYQRLCRVDPNKPIMLGEWGVGEFPKAGSKARWIAEFLERAPRDFPRLRAAVFWHERWQNGDRSISNLRVNSSQEALEAYRKGIGGRFWLSRPRFEP